MYDAWIVENAGVKIKWPYVIALLACFKVTFVDNPIQAECRGIVSFLKFSGSLWTV